MDRGNSATIWRKTRLQKKFCWLRGCNLPSRVSLTQPLVSWGLFHLIISIFCKHFNQRLILISFLLFDNWIKMFPKCSLKASVLLESGWGNWGCDADVCVCVCVHVCIFCKHALGSPHTANLLFLKKIKTSNENFNLSSQTGKTILCIVAFQSPLTNCAVLCRVNSRLSPLEWSNSS